MHIRTKVFLSVGGTLFILFFIVYNILSYVLEADFLALERQSVEENVRRVSDALDNKIDDLAIKVSDWGQWDDTYAFVQDGNQDYLDANLQDIALELLHIQFVVIADEEGSILFKKQIDQEGKQVPFSENFERYIEEHPILTVHEDGQSVHSGIIVLPEGVIANVSRAVTSSDGLSPVKGTIMFSFFIDEEVVEKLSELTHLEMALKRYDEALLDPEFALAAVSLENEGEVSIAPRKETDRLVRGFALKNDIDGKKALLVEAILERSVYQRGQQSQDLFAKIMIGVGIVVILVVLYLFEYLVLRRLFYLGKAVEDVSQGKESEARISLPGKDEFSSLADRINTMLIALRQMEVRRRESEKRFRTVADSAPVMIWMSDLEGKYTYVNRVWLDFTGRTLEQELGFGWQEDVHPDDERSMEATYKAAFAKQAPFNIEYRLKHADGTYGWVFARAVPHFALDQTFLGYIGSCVDISEIKRIEEQKQEYIEEMESMNRIMVERELKMIELKEKIKKLEDHA